MGVKGNSFFKMVGFLWDSLNEGIRIHLLLSEVARLNPKSILRDEGIGSILSSNGIIFISFLVDRSQEAVGMMGVIHCNSYHRYFLIRLTLQLVL